MPIKAIELENFKGIGSRVRVELKPITLLFGANSAGKSTILQSLHYAREILARRNTDPDRTQYGGDRIDLGGFQNLVHNHDHALPVTLSFDLDLSDIDLIDYLPASSKDPRDQVSPAHLDQLSGEVDSATVCLVVKWSEVSEEPIQADYQVAINGEWLARVRTNPESPTQHVIEFNVRHQWIYPEDEWRDAPPETQEEMARGVMLGERETWREFAVEPTNALSSTRPAAVQSLIDEIQQLLAAYDLEEVEAEVSFALLATGNYLLQQLNSIRYLGPIREVPSRGYRPSLSPDDSRWASGLGAWDWILGASPKKLTQLNEWLLGNERFNSGYGIDVKRFVELEIGSFLMSALQNPSVLLDSMEDFRSGIAALPVRSRLVMRQEPAHLEVAPLDIGIGISQMIPVVVACLDSAERITAIEQPELHIHPALQVVLGDLFIHAAKEIGSALLIETHSEHLLLRLLRRIRETASGELPPNVLGLHPDQLSVIYVEGAERGIALTSLSVDSSGEFTQRWPRGFFEERADELF